MSDVVSKKTVDEIIEEINQIDITEIKLDAKALEFLKTLEAYIHCFDELEKLYDEIDPTHQLANYDLSNPNLQIQQVAMTGKPVKNLAELYEAAEAMLPVFQAKINGLKEQLTSNSPEESSGVEFKLAPLKDMVRASEKAQDDYSKKKPGPAESWLYDIVRGSLLFDDAEKLFQFLEVIRADESIVIVKSKNRFCNPTLSGYRDFNMQIQITSDEDGSKHICELQLHIAAIKEGDTRLGSHAHYEFFRNYYAGATGSLEERMNDLRLICKGGSLDMAFLTNVIENQLEVDQMKRLADLFQHYMNEYQLAILIINAIRGRLKPQYWYTRLGNLLQSQGKLEEALVLHQESLYIKMKALGREHAKVADCYYNMAIVLKKQGKLEEAMDMYRKVLDIQVKALGPNHTKVARSYNNIGYSLLQQGRLGEALVECQKALDIFMKTLGDNHADTAHILHSIGEILCKQGKLEEATQYGGKALEICLGSFGPYHPRTAECRKLMDMIHEKRKGRSITDL